MTTPLSFSASNIDRRLLCPGSAYEEAKYPSEKSAYADEGTFAHFIAEQCLNLDMHAADVYGVDEVVEYPTFEGTEEATITVDILAYVQDYIDYVEAIMANFDGCLHYVELAVDVSTWTREGQKSVVDSAVWIEDTRELHIIDFKYGKGVEVEAYENGQLLLGALGTLSHIIETQGPVDIESYHLHIVQPRRNHYDKWTQTQNDVAQWANSTRKKVHRIMTDDEGALPLIPTDKGCRFCKAKPHCRALADQALATVSEGFDNIITPFREALEIPQVDVKDVATLTLQEVFDCLYNVDLIKIWCKALEAQAQAYLESGEKPERCDFKLVRSKTNRVWTDEDKADRALGRAGLDVKARFQPRKLITPPTAEKLLGKKHKVMTSHVTKPEGGLTIARLSDKRDEVVTAPLDGFEAVTGD